MEHGVIKKARELEEEAHRTAHNLNARRGIPSAETKNAYLKAAAEYKKKGYIQRSVDNMRDASRYATPEEADKISARIQGLEVLMGNSPVSGASAKSLWAYVAIAFFAVSLFFISLNFTGNAIVDIESQSFTFVGMGFFIVGLIFTSFYFRSKKHKKTKKTKK